MQLLKAQTQNIKKGTTKKCPKILSYVAYKVNRDYGNFINVAIISPETKKKLQVCSWQKLFTPSICKSDKVPGGSGTFTHLPGTVPYSWHIGTHWEYSDHS